MNQDLQLQIDNLSVQINNLSSSHSFPIDIEFALRERLGLTTTNQAFPVGAIYTSVTGTNPSTELGYGTWVAFATGRTLVGVDTGQTEFDTVLKTGGEKTHTLVTSEIPSHRHTTIFPNSTPGTSNTGLGASNVANSNMNTGYEGGDGAHNNLQPYITVYFWKRTI